MNTTTTMAALLPLAFLQHHPQQQFSQAPLIQQQLPLIQQHQQQQPVAVQQNQQQQPMQQQPIQQQNVSMQQQQQQEQQQPPPPPPVSTVTEEPQEKATKPSSPAKIPRSPKIARDRKFLTLREKLNIIADAEQSGAGSRKLAQKYKVGKTQIADILKKRGEIRKELLESSNVDKKRKSPKTDFSELNAQVLAWYRQALTQNISITGPALKEKAKEIAKQMNVSKFYASNGWLYRFRKRNKIQLSSESRSNTVSQSLSV